MKKLWLLSLVVIPFLAVESQAPVPAGFEHWTAADLQILSKTLAPKAAADPHHVIFRGATLGSCSRKPNGRA